jgi:putative drug exporter of the RND superfamily
MRHEFNSALPETDPPPGKETRGRSLVERVATWSIRYRKTVVIGWLVVVAIVFIVGHLAGTSNVPSNDPGQSGVAEATLQRLNVSQPPSESVLIQERAHGGTFRTDPQLRQATAGVVQALAALPKSTASDIQSPATSRSLVSADGRSALVTFNVTGANEDQAVLPALHAVGAVGAPRPGPPPHNKGGGTSARPRQHRCRSP